MTIGNMIEIFFWPSIPMIYGALILAPDAIEYKNKMKVKRTYEVDIRRLSEIFYNLHKKVQINTDTNGFHYGDEYYFYDFVHSEKDMTFKVYCENKEHLSVRVTCREKLIFQSTLRKTDGYWGVVKTIYGKKDKQRENKTISKELELTGEKCIKQMLIIQERIEDLKGDGKQKENLFVVKTGEKTTLFQHEKNLVKDTLKYKEWLSDEDIHKLTITYPKDLNELSTLYRTIEQEPKVERLVDETKKHIQSEIKRMERAIKEQKIKHFEQKTVVIKER